MYFKLIFQCILLISFYGIFFHLCLCYYLLSRRGNNHFNVHFRRIGPVPFLSKNGKDAVREGRNGWKVAYFRPESAFFLCIFYE